MHSQQNLKNIFELYVNVFEHSHAEVTGTYDVADKFSLVHFQLIKCSEIHIFKCVVIKVTKKVYNLQYLKILMGFTAHGLSKLTTVLSNLAAAGHP